MTTTHIEADTSALDFLIESEQPEGDFLGDVLSGLAREPRSIPPKYFYDDLGARLFEAICETPEYYVTRAEDKLLRAVAPQIADEIGPDASIYEPGSGAARKVRILLDAMPRPSGLVLSDISRAQLEAVAQDVAAEFPDLRVGAIAGDFTAALPGDTEVFVNTGRRVCFFPGGTLGNFGPADQIRLLNTFKKMLRKGDSILIGVDRIKDASRLDAAYNDDEGLTAAFNLNLLTRLETELEAALNIEDWQHLAFFNSERGCIEMHLQAIRATDIALDGKTFHFGTGETIRTEESWKFDEAGLERLKSGIGAARITSWTDPDSDFTLALFTL